MRINIMQNEIDVKQKISDDLEIRFYPAHWEDLKKSGLSDEIIKDAHLRSCSPREIFEVAPPSLASKISSMYEIPYPGTRDSRYKIYGEDGEPVIDKKGKQVEYIQKKDAPSHLYLTRTAFGVLNDISNPLWIVEGAKKALRLEQEGFEVVGIDGCWNWKKKDDGSVHDYWLNNPLIEDFSKIPLEGRTIYIPADSDYTKKWAVRKGYLYLMAELMLRGAIVHFVSIPCKGIEKQGVDDYLQRHTKEDLLSLPWTQITSDMLRGIDHHLDWIADRIKDEIDYRKEKSRDKPDLSEHSTMHTPALDCAKLGQKWDAKALCRKVSIIILRKGRMCIQPYFCRRADCHTCFPYYYKRRWITQAKEDIPSPHIAFMDVKDWPSFYKAIQRAKADYHRFTDVNSMNRLTLVLLNIPVETKRIKSNPLIGGDTPAIGWIYGERWVNGETLEEKYSNLLEGFITKPNRPLEGSEMHDCSHKFKRKKEKVKDEDKARVFMVPNGNPIAVAQKFVKKYEAQWIDETTDGKVILKTSKTTEDFLNSIGGNTKKVFPIFSTLDAFVHIVELTAKRKKDLRIEDKFEAKAEEWTSS